MSTPENSEPVPARADSPTIPPPPTPYPATPPSTPSGQPSVVGAEAGVVSGQATSAPAKKRRRWVWPVAAGGAFLLGIGMGGAGGGGADPTTTEEYQEVLEQRDRALAAAEAAESRAQARIDAADSRQEQLAQRQSELDTREAAVAAREAAVTGAEQQAAANQVGDGIWTVGRDIEPGTYRTIDAVTDTCYWGIYRSGSNGADIIENDIVTGGFPTVTLTDGQDFNSNRCGTWARQ